MITSEKITQEHQTKKAVIYVRQSTPNQVISNQESLQLQYALKQRAIELGWNENDIVIIDSDLGLTGSSITNREGFKYMLTEVTLGNVGIILSYDVTRLSRNCSDWYPLLDICAYRNCLISDRDSIYNPSTTNDRLLLGLKGQLAEAELSTIRARLNAGLLNKAKRGDLALKLPVGFLRDKHNQVNKDPNIEVQQALDMIFNIFLKEKSIAKTLRFFRNNSLLIPRYNKFHELVWKKASLASISCVLKNPVYAGTFAYGRTKKVYKKGSLSDKIQKCVPQSEWRFVVHDKYPSYIAWGIFEKIQSMLKDNYAEYKKNKTRGIPRKGQTLLQGILYCGECGHKMTVKYKDKAHYLCEYLKHQYGAPLCQFIPQEHVDQVVAEAFFQALSPIELNAYEEIRKTQKQQMEQLAKSRSLQLERLRYQAELAGHQFNQVDPSNRLVAGELEKRWECALHDLKETEDLVKKDENINPAIAIPEALRNAFLDIGKNLPGIWDKKSLSYQSKKSLLRCLIDKVIAHREKPDTVAIRIVWKGSAFTNIKTKIPVKSLKDMEGFEMMEQIIIELSTAKKGDSEIADYLTKKGYRSPSKEHVLERTVERIRLNHKIYHTKYQPKHLHIDGFLTATRLAKILDVNETWIYSRIRNGNIKIEKNAKTRCYMFSDNHGTIELMKKLKNGEVESVDFLKGVSR